MKIQLTLGEDDICGPCKYINNGLCIDEINHINDINSKDKWNKILDKRIIEYTKFPEESECSACEYCEKLYLIKEHIFHILKEETDYAKKDRYNAFCAGAIKYLKINQSMSN